MPRFRVTLEGSAEVEAASRGAALAAMQHELEAIELHVGRVLEEVSD